MTAVTQANTTYARIEQLVRRLTASSGESALKSTEIQQTINDIYNNDFPNAIKTDQMRSVYTFFTQPNIDRYPVDVNYNQGFRNPIYIEGIQGFFTKDRDEFYRLWPRWPTKFQASAPIATPTIFSFTIPGPFLSQEVVIGGVDSNGNAISINDDGNGGLWMQTPNPQISVPTYGAVYPSGSPQAGFPIPGMYNQNLFNPGLNLRTNVGSVNYVTGAMAFTLPLALQAGTTLTVFVSQYQTGRPYSLLFWNNVITVRPVPKLIHKIELEVYLTPVQFMLTTDSPIMNQWVKYLAYASAVEILRQRQDMEGVQNLMEGFLRQEGLVLERQAVEEINSRNQTVFASSQGYAAGNYGWNQGWWGG